MIIPKEIHGKCLHFYFTLQFVQIHLQYIPNEAYRSGDQLKGFNIDVFMSLVNLTVYAYISCISARKKS